LDSIRFDSAFKLPDTAQSRLRLIRRPGLSGEECKFAAISQPHDASEVEADAPADKVMRPSAGKSAT
jgi:hypothetical protein